MSSSPRPDATDREEAPALESLSARTDKVVRWIEANVGGRVTAIDPQARWRPVWFATVEGAPGEDGPLELCVRGDRLDCRHGFPLENEMRLQALLHEHGVPVARVHGWCDNPRAYVMDRVEGVEHFQQVDDATRDAVMRHYMEILAQIHALPVAPFADAGLLRAPKPELAWRIGLDTYVDAYRAVKKRPDPFLEFCLGWIDRNPLPGPYRETPIVWDSGQLMHANGRVTAAIDLELGHIGDPMMDLAGFRMRTSVLGFGDFEALYDHYAASGGQPIDRGAIQYHHFVFTLSNQLAFHDALAEPPAGSDYMTNRQWCAETNIYAMEALAEILGLDLTMPPMPEAHVSEAAVPHAHMVDWLRHFETDDEYLRHQFRIFFRLARHLARHDEIGAAALHANLDELEPLLGFRPKTWQEGDDALERFVHDDAGRHDAELVDLFHKRCWRYLWLNGPEGSAIARHNPIPDFRVD